VADHTNKHIREALEYAEDRGWTIQKSGPRAHAWGTGNDLLSARAPHVLDGRVLDPP